MQPSASVPCPAPDPDVDCRNRGEKGPREWRETCGPRGHTAHWVERLKGGGQAGAFAPFLSLGSQQIKVDAAPLQKRHLDSDNPCRSPGMDPLQATGERNRPLHPPPEELRRPGNKVASTLK